MIITWDERKRLVNLDKHAIDFADLDEQFFRDAAIYSTRERRFIAIGKHADWAAISVIFRRLGREGLSIISARPSNLRERRMIDE